VIFFNSKLSAQCGGVSVTVPSDITICDPQDVLLDGSINGNYLGHEWIGTDGFSNTTNLSPTVNVTQTTTYKFTAQVLPTGGTNLITNGNFESGNSGFTTQYNHIANPGGMALWNKGTYTVAKNPKSYHMNFDPCDDHTSGSGKMMILNGSGSLSIIWCQTISVNPNTYYVFDAWATSVENTSPAELQFSINNGLIGSIFNLSSNTCLWQNFNALWYSNTATSVNICVTNQNTTQSGNDFALDDISFREACEVVDSFTVTIADFDAQISGDPLIDCSITSSTLTANTLQAGNYTYNWFSSNANFTNGTSDNEIIVENGGNFNLVVTDNNNCTRTANFDVIEDKNYPESTFLISDTLDCETNQVTIFSTPSNTNVTYNWQGPNGFTSTDQNPMVGVDGQYIVTITNPINHCTNTYDVEVIKNTNLPSFDLTIDGNLTCADKVVNLSSTNATSGLNFNWSGPSIISSIVTGSSVNVNAPGQYQLLVTNSNGCSELKTINVGLTPPAIQSISPNQPIVNCLADSFQLMAVVKGKWDSIKWNGPALFKSTAIQPYIKKEGTYFVTVIDSNGCTINDTILIGKNKQVPLPTHLLKPIDCVSKNGSVVLFATDSLINASLLAGNTNLVFDQPNVLTNEGKYNIQVTARNGCKDTFEINLLKDEDFPQNTIDYNNINCIKTNSNIVTITNQDSVTYDWKNANGSLGNAPSLSVNAGGAYFLTSTSNKGCVSYDTIVIEIDTIAPNFNIETTALSCKNKTVLPTLLFEDQNLNYSWNGPKNFSSISKTPLLNEEGKYWIEATGPNGCKTLKNISVIKDSRLPDAKVNGPDVLNCKTLFVEQKYTSISGLDQIMWFGQNLQNTSSQNIAINKPGSYFLTGAHPNSGCKDTFEFAITQNLVKPTFTLSGDDTINCLIKNVEKIVSTSNGLVEWKKGNSLLNSGNKNLKFDAPGAYKILVTNNLSFCKDSLNFAIYADTVKPVFDLTFDSITCKSNKAKIAFNTNNQYVFSFSQNDIIKTNSGYYLTSVGGIKTANAIGKNGCLTSKSFEILVDTVRPTFTYLSGDIDCKENPVNLLIKLNNPTNNISVLENNIVLTTGPSLLVKTPTSLTVVVKDINNGCESTENIVIKKVDNGPSGLKFNLPFSCETYSKQFQFQKVEKVSGNYKLYIDDVIINEKELLSLSEGKHKLTLIDNEGCITSEEFDLPTFERPQIDDLADIEINYGDKAQINVKTTLEAQDIKNIKWIPTIDLSCTNCLNPITISKENINYKVILTDNYGCEIDAEIRITLKYIAEIFFPNIIKYNNSSNSTFYPVGTETIEKANYLYIYDRWGNRVYTKENFKINDPSISWDGTFKGTKLMNGVYTFVAQFTTIKGDQFNYVGDVTLLD
jgi:hypothetical protein